MTTPGRLTSGQRDWLRVRSYLAEDRHQLTLDAAAAYPACDRVAGTALLAVPGWQPAAPVPLRDISLERAAAAPGPAEMEPGVTDATPVLPAPLVLPARADGTRYQNYSDALSELAAPAIFANRPTYRLTEAELTSAAPRLAFARGRYFDGIDTGEAAAHEFAAIRLGAEPAGLRAGFGDPCDLRRRPANMAITTMTLRLDQTTGRASFPLHWRDPAKVGHAGGLYQVIPAGIFQPSGAADEDDQRDFSLWRNMIREFDEELRGRSEDYGTGADYDFWPFARRMTAALEDGELRVWCLGLGVDPLTFATDLLTVAVIDSVTFDELFGVAPRRNEEGRVLAAREFEAHVIDRLVTREPLQASGAAVLRLAWDHREALTGG
jgi:hypothetical protein